MPSCGVCVCVRVSVTFVGCVKTNKHIEIFSPPGSHTILVFPCQTAWQYSDWDPLVAGLQEHLKNCGYHVLRTTYPVPINSYRNVIKL